MAVRHENESEHDEHIGRGQHDDPRPIAPRLSNNRTDEVASADREE
jgi:hypothetical protein